MVDNVELVRGAYAAFARGDIAAILASLDDAVEWSSPVTLPQGGDFTGRDGVTRFFEGVGAAWESLHIEVEAVGELGDDLGVGVVRCSGSLREGGPGEYGAVHVFTVKNNKIIRFREYVDLDRPIAVAGDHVRVTGDMGRNRRVTDTITLAVTVWRGADLLTAPC